MVSCVVWSGCIGTQTLLTASLIGSDTAPRRLMFCPTRPAPPYVLSNPLTTLRRHGSGVRDERHPELPPGTNAGKRRAGPTDRRNKEATRVSSNRANGDHISAQAAHSGDSPTPGLTNLRSMRHIERRAEKRYRLQRRDSSRQAAWPSRCCVSLWRLARNQSS
jgi:hypothetical protein